MTDGQIILMIFFGVVGFFVGRYTQDSESWMRTKEHAITDAVYQKLHAWLVHSQESQSEHINKMLMEVIPKAVEEVISRDMKVIRSDSKNDMVKQIHGHMTKIGVPVEDVKRVICLKMGLKGDEYDRIINEEANDQSETKTTV